MSPGFRRPESVSRMVRDENSVESISRLQASNEKATGKEFFAGR